MVNFHQKLCSLSKEQSVHGCRSFMQMLRVAPTIDYLCHKASFVSAELQAVLSPCLCLAKQQYERIVCTYLLRNDISIYLVKSVEPTLCQILHDGVELETNDGKRTCRLLLSNF